MIHKRVRLRPSLRQVGLTVRVLIGALVTGLAIAAVPSSASASAGTYRQIGHGYLGIIQGYSNGTQMCMDNRAALNWNAYNPVQEYQCNGTGAQDWYYEYDNTIYLQVSPYETRTPMCLTAAGNSAGDSVYILTCSIGSNFESNDTEQQWVAMAGGALHNVASGLCLDDTAWATNGHTQLDVWPCDGAANQRWLGDH